MKAGDIIVYVPTEPRNMQMYGALGLVTDNPAYRKLYPNNFTTHANRVWVTWLLTPIQLEEPYTWTNIPKEDCEVIYSPEAQHGAAGAEVPKPQDELPKP